MGRPQTKAALIEQAMQQFNQLMELVNDLSAAEKSAAFSFDKPTSDKAAHWDRDKNLRDVFIHLYEWHQLLLNWATANFNNQPQPFLPAPYNWKTYTEMNMMFWNKHQITPYDDAEAMLINSHHDVLHFIDSLPAETLFEKGYYDWSGTTSVGSYCVSATCSHYAWAIKKIKRHRKHVRC
ncbi:hypothetical protein DES38_11811 [Streptohalobacillus salinus]|uniref:DinB family protein n=1 Tax=Streptohalobacillus salinus TaxID=621096 RepID=A0A2V3W3J4_9BACI|nr:ClbS/DfsB family four-helix bundle protein [Streptohalobacillus salinus]PXW86825.1 hypothetical protein DES38_11811 [Streptohalobacillus salinus]